MIASILSAAGQAGSYLLQRDAENRQFNRSKEMQDRANAQNINFWNMQNAYNSPEAQMQRMKDAGLNPALMYGKGASAGNAGAIAPSKSAATPSFNPNPLQLGQASMMSAQHDNLKASALATLANAALTKQTKKHADMKIDRALNLMDAQTDSLETKTRIDKFLEGVQRDTREATIAEIKARAATAGHTELIKKAEALLRENGLSPNSPLWERFLGTAFVKATEGMTAKDIMAKISEAASFLTQGINPFNWF